MPARPSLRHKQKQGRLAGVVSRIAVFIVAVLLLYCTIYLYPCQPALRIFVALLLAVLRYLGYITLAVVRICAAVTYYARYLLSHYPVETVVAVLVLVFACK